MSLTFSPSPPLTSSLPGPGAELLFARTGEDLSGFFVTVRTDFLGAGMGWIAASAFGPPRGHDNVHDDMNMYVIMHDQCLFIAMINSFHT